VSNKQARDILRIIHLITGGLLAVYLYAPLPLDDTPVELLVEGVVLPVLALSGVVMWQWPRISGKLGRRGTRR
jgi:hypothetical protein